MHKTTLVKTPEIWVKDTVSHSELPQEQTTILEKVDVYETDMVRDYLNGVDIASKSSADMTGPLYDRARKNEPKQFPTKKPGRYSKDRRFIPIPKKSDIAQIQSGTRKGAKSKKRKMALNNGD